MMLARNMTTTSSMPLATGGAVRGLGRGSAIHGRRWLSGQAGQPGAPQHPRSGAAVRGMTTTVRTQQQHASPVPASSKGESSAGRSAAPPDPRRLATADGDVLPGTDIRVFRTVAGLRAWRRRQLLAGRTVGLVPTMGALHAGHLELAEAAARDNDDVVVSIYVNPTQFGVHEDLGSYPRTWAADCRVLAHLNEQLASGRSGRSGSGPASRIGSVSAVFAPTTPEMYPSGRPGQEVDAPGSFVTITPVGSVLEGASRPTFFRGVATVCMKLFHIVQPERAYFGQKDVQQTVVVRRMVQDFCVPLRIIVCPTVREQPDGLALSSRNVYLGPRRRAVAPVLRQALVAAAAEAATAPVVPAQSILAAAHRVADETLAVQKALPPHERALFEIDYLSLADPDTMLEIRAEDPVDWRRGAILSGAVRMLPVEAPQPGEDLGHSGGPMVRLIDNIILEPTQ